MTTENLLWTLLHFQTREKGEEGGGEVGEAAKRKGGTIADMTKVACAHLWYL
jgi:hypothetical protein